MPPTQSIKHETAFWPVILIASLLATAFFYYTLGVEETPENRGGPPELPLFFSVILVVTSLWALIVPPRILLSPYGFRYRALWTWRDEDWLKVSKLRTEKTIKGKTILAYNYTNDPGAGERYIEYNFGYEPADLAELMNKYHAYAQNISLDKLND